MLLDCNQDSWRTGQEPDDTKLFTTANIANTIKQFIPIFATAIFFKKIIIHRKTFANIFIQALRCSKYENS